MLNRILSFQTLLMILALAFPASADPPAAWSERMQVFRDWRLDCRADPCTRYVSVAGAGEAEVLRLALSAGAAPALTVSTPLPLFLPDGVVLAIGDEPERPVAWRTCGPAGCEATAPLDTGLLAALRRERGGSATLTLVDGVRVRLPFSLLGFSAALEAGGPLVSLPP